MNLEECVRKIEADDFKDDAEEEYCNQTVRRFNQKVSCKQALDEFFQWVNSPRREPGRLRIRTLLALVRKRLDIGVPSLSPRAGAIHSAVYIAHLPEILRLTKETDAMLNSRLRRYRFVPTCWLWGDSLFHFVPSNSPDETRKRSITAEQNAVQTILRLAESGELDKLRQCECGAWFLGRRDRRFCGPVCRQKPYRASESFRAHRREYMRRYYAQNFKQQDVRRRNAKQL